MLTSENGWQQAYNLKAVVDMDSHLILTGHVSQRANDKQEIEPALEQIDKLPETLGEAGRLAADNGYLSEDNVAACEEQDITPYIATGRKEHNPGWKKRLTAPEEPPPEGARRPRSDGLPATGSRPLRERSSTPGAKGAKGPSSRSLEPSRSHRPTSASGSGPEEGRS